MSVINLQTILRFRGFPIEVDGVFGSQTVDAIKNFQKVNGLVVDGIVGPKTREILYRGEIFQKDLISLYGHPLEIKERRQYLKMIDLKEFTEYFSIKDFTGRPWNFKFLGHFLLEERLRRAFKLIIERKLTSQLKTFDGCFNPRKSKSGGWSVHSWGLAVDFNAAENPYGGEPKFKKELIYCFIDAGFTAGYFWNPPDGMHFQIPRL